MSYTQAREAYGRDKAAYASLTPFIEEHRPVIDHEYSLIGDLLPEHVLSKASLDDIRQGATAFNPIGNGPFKVEKVENLTYSGQIVMVANPRYNLTSPPLLKRLVFQYSFDDSFRDRLKNGEFDVVASNLISQLPQEYIPTDPGYRVDYTLSLSLIHI